jgi:hypothetical protein
MPYCLSDQEIAMVLQDPTIYSEPVLEPYLYGVSTDQLAHPLPYASPSPSHHIQPEMTDWWLWPEQSYPKYDVAPQQDLFNISPSPKQITAPDSSLQIEALKQQIIALECKVERLDELERRFSQIEEAGQRLCQLDEIQRRLYQVEATAEMRHIEFVTPPDRLTATDTHQQIRRRESHARIGSQSACRTMGRADQGVRQEFERNHQRTVNMAVRNRCLLLLYIVIGSSSSLAH